MRCLHLKSCGIRGGEFEDIFKHLNLEDIILEEVKFLLDGEVWSDLSGFDFPPSLTRLVIKRPQHDIDYLFSLFPISLHVPTHCEVTIENDDQSILDFPVYRNSV